MPPGRVAMFRSREDSSCWHGISQASSSIAATRAWRQALQTSGSLPGRQASSVAPQGTTRLRADSGPTCLGCWTGSNSGRACAVRSSTCGWKPGTGRRTRPACGRESPISSPKRVRRSRRPRQEPLLLTGSTNVGAANVRQSSTIPGNCLVPCCSSVLGNRRVRARVASPVAERVKPGPDACRQVRLPRGRTAFCIHPDFAVATRACCNRSGRA